MGIPKKAVRESHLKILTAGPAVSGGSHQIVRVTLDEGGIEKSGFYKKLDPENRYPELLAKIDVAASAFLRIFLGDHCAEERLVFDGHDRIVGILSFSLDGFTPLNFAGEPIPPDPTLRELVIPNKELLLAKNVMEVIVACWYIFNDDLHPHNMGFVDDHTGLIDFDMTFYELSVIIKESRPLVGKPEELVFLTVPDYETLPCVEKLKPFHWPTHIHAGRESKFLRVLLRYVPSELTRKVLWKSFANPGEFRMLAADIRAHEQKLAAVLKALLTYDPVMMRHRLVELFGDLTLNYNLLNDEVKTEYENQFPYLFNEETNNQLFVDFMLQIYQKRYDNLYRVVVFYSGCKNNGHGIPLDATCSSLYNKPSYYQEIIKWAIKQNENIPNIEGEGVHYNLDVMEKRYHQVWRDSFAPQLKRLLVDSFNLTNEVYTYNTSSPSQPLVAIKENEYTDTSMVQAWELFVNLPKLSEDLIDRSFSGDKDSKPWLALIDLVRFTNRLHELIKTYYDKECRDLITNDNTHFVNEIKKLYNDYYKSIRKNLGFVTSYADEYNRITSVLKQFSEQADFDDHLTITDIQVHDRININAVQKILPIENQSVLTEFCSGLFSWAQKLKAEDLTSKILFIIDNFYKPTMPWFYNRHRNDSVRAYTLASQNESGDIRLAHILCSGGTEVGALNSLLIEHLTPEMLQSNPLPSLIKVQNEGKLAKKTDLLTGAAVKYAKTESSLTNLYSPKGVELFYKTMFDWIDGLGKNDFSGIINSSLGEYRANSGLFKLDSRKSELREYCRDLGQATAVAFTFLNGPPNSSLSDVLFHKIIKAIQADILKNPIKRESPGYRLISYYNPQYDKEFYQDQRRSQSVGPSHQQALKQTAPAKQI